MICGNHDEHIKKNKLLPNCYSIDSETADCYTPVGFVDNTEPGGHTMTRAKELFTSTNDVLTVKHGKHTFFLSHYSHQVWLGSHRGFIHLFGHSHDSIEGIGKSMDVGIDVAKRLLGKYRPFSIEEVINIMDKKEIVFLDKHNPSTNV